MSNSWRPTATIDDLKTRAELIQKIRHFFLKRDIWEVETPCLSQAASTDIHLHSFETQFHGPGFSKGLPLYLMTSPEFHMKRLLAAGSGPIFQISKAFRNEEAGRYHNPEFTMLEWYRPDFDHHDLMDEVGDLLHEILSCSTPDKISYQDAFRRYLNVCPLDADIDTLRKVAHQYDLDDIAASEDNKDTLLQLLFNLGVESQIGKEKPCFVYDFPASQAALAKVSTKDPRVASRFEVYFHGIELANGFHELDDPSEQQRRFEADNAQRLSLQLPSRPIDHHLINAISYGLPSCAGVAIGIDRLLMLALSKDHLHQVQAFSIERA